MPVSDSKRRAIRKYDKAHYTTISVKVSIPEAQTIRAACAYHNTTASTICRAALLDIVRNTPPAALPDDSEGDNSIS